MNDEYIRRVEAEEAIEEYCCRMCKEYREIEGGCVSHAQHCEQLSGEEILKSVKSADVQPIKKGRWSECYTDSRLYSGICTVCGKASIRSIKENPLEYCPKCGARMDGDTECQ